MSDRNDLGLVTDSMGVSYGGVVANKDVSISVMPGEVVGLIGPNGAGKTSFIDGVTGFTAVTGTIRLAGEHIEKLTPHQRRRRGLARTWQAGELFTSLSAADNLRVATKHSGLAQVFRDIFARRDQSADPDIARLLDIVGLGDKADVRAGDLPLGEQKLLGVARALVGQPSIILLDEPGAGLDSVGRAELSEAVKHIAAEGVGVLLIDHDTDLVLNTCGRVYVLEFGELIFDGTSSAARTDDRVLRAYLGLDTEATS